MSDYSGRIGNGEGELSIEDAFARLEEITAGLENSGTSLKASIELYKEGAELAAACRSYLEDVEKEIKLVMGEDTDE